MALMITKHIALLASLFLFASCNMNIVYDEQVPVEDGKWPFDQSARFDVDISDTLNGFDFYLLLRNDDRYRYSNLFIFMTTRFPNGNLTRDTLEFVLADAEGRWLGKGWGSIRENDILLRENLNFPLAGKYEFILQQAMREDTLVGITDVGLRIEKNN
jgi:gliding motility-associated lipoprotein GldH